MDQVKIGEFLKTLRKEKNITQEELADKMLVSRRTVSRWETGNNLPDLSVLIELADFYDVDLREILNGQRKDTTMDNEYKETLLMAADYVEEKKQTIVKRMHVLFIIATFLGMAYFFSIFMEDYVGESAIFSFLQGVCLGTTLGMCLVGIIVTNEKALNKLAELKSRK